MRRVKITLPATLTHIGPGIGALGLAVGLRASVTLVERGDTTLSLESNGDDAQRYPVPLEHPVVRAAARLFQQVERAPAGFSVYVDNPIPLRAGLGAETALYLAGVMGAANLIDTDLPREALLSLAATITDRADGVVAAALGGLTVGTLHAGALLHRSLAPAPMDLVIVYPRVKHYTRKAAHALNKTVDYTDAVFHLSRLPLLIEAFREGDYHALGLLLEDRIHMPHLLKHHPHYDEAAAAARREGAAGVTLSGLGPSLVAFARRDHERIAAAMCAVFEANATPVQSWVLPVDRQGIVVSMTQSV